MAVLSTLRAVIVNEREYGPPGFGAPEVVTGIGIVGDVIAFSSLMQGPGSEGARNLISVLESSTNIPFSIITLGLTAIGFFWFSHRHQLGPFHK